MEEITGSSNGLEIAVIGMAVRFPGARNIKEFLHNLKNGMESLCFFRDEELLRDGEEAELLTDPNYIRSRGYLPEGDCFDAEFFGYTPAEAAVMDPQLRVFHECTWEALEDAGYDPGDCDGLIGLYAGASTNLYRQMLLMLPGVVRGMDSFSLLQLTNKDNLTTWISYNFNLKGPSYVVQTACSTSLVAIHVASQALLSGECNIALAGGVTVIYPRKAGYIYQEGMVGSPDGHCRPFDAAARGIVGGEGCGVVVLKLLEDALQDRDHIHAIIKGSAINNDGKQKTGYTAPSIKGQMAVIKSARKMAEVEPHTIGYIEAHGTGTVLGDPIEIEALKQAFKTEKSNFCGIGSVKSNIGHLDIAAGVASFVKTVLSLKEKIIFPCLHFKIPNPKIDFENSPFFVPTGLSHWKNNSRPLRAGVSSFGIGGTNAHLVLEEAPPTRCPANRDTGDEQHLMLMLLSARTPTALQKAAENIILYLKENPGIDLADAAYTLQVGRRHFKYRKTAVYSTMDEAIEILAAAKTGNQASQARDKNRMIFMFPGFGGQAVKVNMGLELYQREPVFRQAMDRCFETLDELMGYDIKEILYPGGAGIPGADINRIEIAQPIIFAFEYALVRLLKSWGIIPDAMIGYSISEYVAALVSGVFSLEDAIKLAVTRVQLIKKLPVGAMLSVPLTAEQLRTRLEAEENKGLYLAIDNGSACIVSGAEEKVTAFERQLKKQLLLCMRLPAASYAAHSGAMSPILKEFEAVVSRIKANEPQIPYISNVTGQWTTKEEACDPRHWSRHISGTVLFADGIRQLVKMPNTLFIEVGPGRELTLMVRRFIKQEGTAGQEVLNLLQNPTNPPKPGQSDYRYLLRRLGYLWGCGVTIDWHGFHQGKERYRVPLPTYPFQHRRYTINNEIFAYWRQILSGKFAGNLAPPAMEIEKTAGSITGNKQYFTFKLKAEIADVPYAPPKNPIQATLVNIWQRFFGITGIGVRHDFFELGGDSLKAMNVSNLIRKELQVEIPVAEFFQRQTIEALAAYIMEKARQTEFYSINPIEKKDYYPLSPAQKRLYFIQRMIQDSTAYNMPHFVTIQREMNRERLEFVCHQLIQRWESYRTSFEMINEGPVQRIHRQVEFKLEYDCAKRKAQSTECKGERNAPGAMRFAGTIKDFFRPFDLSRAPLFRLGLIETGRDKYILMVDMHHIVSDGTSYLIWEKEMMGLYTGEQLPELKLQYKDYSGWKNSELRKAALNHQEKYWLKTFGGELPVVNLPADYPRPPLQQFEGANIDFLLNEKETRIIKTIMAESEVTLYMVLLSIYTILLSKLSGQEDIIIGTPIAGRSHAELQYIIGMFVNTLAMRNYPSGQKGFNEFLAEVKDNTLKAFENQDYQFEDLVDNLSVPRNISRNPVFDFMLNLLNQEEYLGPIPEVNEHTGYGFAHREGTSKFDWNLTVIDLGERLLLNLEYSTSLYKAGTIEKAVGYFRNIMSALSSDRTTKLTHLEILTSEQKQEILHHASGVEENRDIRDTIQRLFEEQVEETPDNTAVVGPALINYRTYMTYKTYISYRELNEKSNRLAWLLREKGIRPNNVVGLMAERSLEMIIAMLAILKVGAAYLPLDDDYPEERKKYMLEDSGVKVLLTIINQNKKTGSKPAYIPGNIEPIDLASEKIYQAEDSNPGRINRGADLLYVIYTSGSTGKPKGVMLEHRNLVNLVKYQFEYTNIDFSKVLQFTTISFDVSFQEIFSTLIAGGTLVLIDIETRNDIPRLFKTIEKNDIKTLFLPASYLKFVISEENYIDLMPGNVKHIVTAGEQAVITDEMRRYLRVNGVYFYNHYGPTESHVVTTLTLGPDEELPHLPSIGRPVANTAIYIMNKAMHLVPTGVPGELVIGGMQVGRGYLNGPELTNQKFLRGESRCFTGAVFSKSVPPGRRRQKLYCTGDLARWLAEGNIEFLGRIDYQVKIRGFRVELGEIESRLLNHPDIKEAVVPARRDEQGNIYLCTYIVSDKNLIVSDLREYLAAGLPDYMVPQYFMQLERIPLNPNGKIDRKALPEPVIKPGERYTAPRNEIEEKLADIWQEVLGIDRGIGIDDNFFELGGHSLKATILATKIHKILNIRVSLAEIFQTPDIRGIARYIMETETRAVKPARYLPLGPYEEKDYYPLSSAQKRLYVLNRLVLSDTVYNLPVVVVLEGEADRQRVEEAFHKLIQRHESFRTSFVMVKGEPYQKIHHEVEFEIEYYNAGRRAQSAERKDERHAPCAVHCSSTIKNFIRPFALSQAPLLRVGLIALPHTPAAHRGHPSQEGKEHKYILIVDMHHIISDGVSIVILMREFMVFYRGLSLPPVGVRYRDYSQWQNREKETPAQKQKQTYWVRQFPGEIPVLELPIDFARPSIQSFAGSNKFFHLSVSETRVLNRLASQREVTMFMLLLAIYIIFLSKISGQEDIVVGTPIAGRNHADLQSIVGVFINTLVLRNQPVGNKTFSNFLKEVRELALQAYENQEYPFEDLVEQVNVTRDTGQNPIFDTMFTMQNFDIQLEEIPVIRTPGLKLQPYHGFEGQISKFDLTLSAGEANERLDFFFEYCTRLFKEETIERFICYFKQVVYAVLRDPGIKLSRIEIIPGEEKQRILIDFNNTAREYPGNKTIQRLFEKQVERTPDNTALVGGNSKFQIPNSKYRAPFGQISSDFGEGYLTYRDLNNRANRLAHLLIERSIQSDTIVGIMGERSLEMMIGILGILKSGGAYLPIDPDYPQARIDYMLKDSNAKILLTRREITPFSSLQAFKIRPKSPLSHLRLSPAPATSLAYIMYTSGTTGKPKGVMVNHRNVVRLVINANYIELTGETRILQTGAPVFDATTFEIWGTLLHGGQLVLVGNDIITEADKMGEALVKYKITTLWLTSPLFNQLMRQNNHIFSGLNYLLVGGDVLSPGYIDMVRKENKKLSVINGYGPTENTTFSTTYLVDKDFQGNIPIGKPIGNSTAYILDKNGYSQPVRVAGELYVGGDGVSRGYLNHPELTCEKFKIKNNKLNIKNGSGTLGMNLNAFGEKNKKAPGKEIQGERIHMPHRSYRSHMSYIYQTGDLARWIADGNIEFLGRIDDQVKIRGFRVEPGEIEHHLLAHKLVKEAVVAVKPQEDGDKYLCAYIVSDPEIELAQLRQWLSCGLPDHMVPGYWMRIEKIPLTPNGKVQRSALPDPVIPSNTGYIAPRDEVEEKLVEIWREVLGPGINVGIEDNFFEMGGHSLKAAVLTAKMHQTFGGSVPLAEVFRTPTISELAVFIKKNIKGKQAQYISIESVEKKDYYVVSSAQKRLYILNRLEKEGISYNIPAVLELEGRLDKDKLENTFRRLVHCNESFRTSFEMVSTEPVQRVHDNVEFEIEYYCAERKAQSVERQDRRYAPSAMRCANTIKDFIRPFDLSRAPLLRVGLIALPHTPAARRGHPRRGTYNSQEGKEHKFILMVDMHHIVSDGTSMGILVKDFMALYAGRELSQSRFHYKDYSQWQIGDKQVQTIRRQEGYWLNQFEGEVPVLELPMDYTRPVLQSFAGASLNFEITGERTAALKTLASQADATLYMLLFSIFNLLLSKLSGQEDIIIGTPTVGRTHADLGQIIGMFVNTLALRHFPHGDKSFKTLLEEVKNNTLKAFENQDYHFEDLIEKVKINRDTGRNPLFDVMFTLQNLGIPTLEIPGLILKPHSYETNTSKFDITLTGFETGQKLFFTIEYCRKLFKQETIQGFVTYFNNIVTAVLAAPGKKIKEIEIISAEEKERILIDFNDTAGEYPGNKTIYRLFEEQVERTPDNTALVGGNSKFQIPNSKQGVPFGQISNTLGEGYLTYRDLNNRADRLAHLLIEKGVKPDTIVAIMVERSLEMIIGILGILKSCGAYLPIDPDYPQARIDYMLKDSGVKILVTVPGLSEKFEKLLIVNCQLLIVNEIPSNRRRLNNPPKEANSINNYQLTINNLQLKGNNLAYIIYTSGTTGKPKGNLTTHTNVIRVVKNTNYIQLTGKDRILQLSNYAFDGSVFDIYGALLNGSVLVLVDREKVLAVDQLAALIKQQQITVFFVTTALFNTLIDMQIDCFHHIKKVLFGGERVSLEHAGKALEYMGKGRVIHVYGPTETTVYATYYFIDQIDAEAVTIPIGMPITDTTAYILDKYLQLVPIGVTGLLYIGGEGLARGYLNHPRLTFERFINYKLQNTNYKSQITNKKATTSNEKFLRGGPGGAVFSKSAPTGRRRQKIYKTGDLARWLPEGNIEFLGRIDHQVKIRGFRVELGEIESRLLNHPDIKETVVLGPKDEQGNINLCAYIVSEKELIVSDLREYLAKYLPAYMIPAYLMRVEKIPLNPNGKVDRKALPEPGIKKGEDYVAPRNALEEKLVEIWNDILNPSPGSDVRIGIDDNFFHLGGHSLKATQLTARIHRIFNVKISLGELFKAPTIRAIASAIPGAEQILFTDIKKTEKKDFYELSFNQKRLWFIQQMEPAGSAFNMPGRIILNHRVEEEWIEKTLALLAYRHESLRTYFKVIDDRPVQRIIKEVLLPLKKIGISMLATEEKQQKQEEIFNEMAGAPFDLNKAPLFRAVLLKLDKQMHEFMFNMHHIIADGWSMEIIKRDFTLLYEGAMNGKTVELESMPLQYKDFAVWYNDRLQDPLNKVGSHSFWKTKLENGIPGFFLPGDFTDGRESRESAGYQCMIEKDITEGIRLLAERRSTTSFTVMFSVYILLLSRLSGEQEVVCSIIGAGREHASLHPIVGFFVNSIIYHTHVDFRTPFDNFLERVKADTLELFQHQDYPLESVFEELGMRYPEISVTFNMLNMGESLAAHEWEPIENAHIENPVQVKFDLEPYITEYKNGLQIYLSYKKNLFRPETIAFIAKEYINMIDFLTRNPGKSYLDYRKSIPPSEPVLERKPYPLEKGFETITLTFEHQVNKTPDRIAIRVRDAHFTYDELNRYASQIACLIGKKLERRPGDNRWGNERVGLLFEHGYDMIAAIIGTLKAGKVYVPLSASYPVKRLSYMLSDSESSLLLTNTNNIRLAAVLAEENQIEVGDVNGLDRNNGDVFMEKPGITGGSPAYILYTSGSTGNPKGVVQSHENVLYYTRNWGRIFSISIEDKMTLFSSFCHDGSVQDMFGALLNGAVLYPYDMKNQEESSPDLSGFLSKEKITIWHSVPSLFGYFLNNFTGGTFPGLRFILLGGEPLRAHEVAMAGKYFPYTTLANIYGQTESSVSSIWHIHPGDSEGFSKVIIGEPLDNTGIVLMDEEQNTGGLLETGEIVVASPHLALGYWKNGEATDKVFFIHPIYGKMYRTGDMGRLLIDGSIEFSGRKDNQVKIRGFRIELGEIESWLLKYEYIDGAVVKVVETGDESGDNYLCAYIVCKSPGVLDKGIEMLSAELKVYLSGLLPDYMIPNFFIRLERLPLTPGGKVDRKALPLPGIGEINRRTFVAPRTWVEIKLLEIWRDVLKIPGDIGIEDDFFELGGHSLKATVMAAKIHKELQVKISLADIFKTPSIRKLAVKILQSDRVKLPGMQRAEKKEYYELSYNQKRLWVIYCMKPNSSSYHMPGWITLNLAVNIEALKKVLSGIFNRHESFRTGFKEVGGEPVQFIRQMVEIPLQVIDITRLENNEKQQKTAEIIRQTATQPFDLQKPPLFRAVLIKQDRGAFVYVYNMHHIISDGWSMEIIKNEFNLLFDKYSKGNQLYLPPLPHRYKDFVQWHNRQIRDPEVKEKAFDYWKKAMQSGFPVLKLPYYYSGKKGDSSGAGYRSVVECGIKIRLRRLAENNSTTLFTLLFTLYNLLLAYLTGEEEIVTTVISAGRDHPSLYNIVGYFINPVIIKTQVDLEADFEVLLSRVNRDVLEVFQHQVYPFENVLEALNVPYPDVSTAFNMLNMQDISRETELDSLKSFHIEESQEVKYHLVLYVTEYKNGIEIRWEYQKSLFKPETIDSIAGKYLQLVDEITEEQ